MKVSYDPRTNTLSIIFKQGVSVVASDEDRPGVILDYDRERNLISLEILDASHRITQVGKIEFKTLETQSVMEVR